MTLTATQIKYLVAIHALDCGGCIRSADIAELLGVSKPTVHSMLVSLSKLSLIKKEKYSVIELTDFGRKIAEKYAVGFSNIRLLLNKQLRIPAETAVEGALAILSCLQTEDLELHLPSTAWMPEWRLDQKSDPEYNKR